MALKIRGFCDCVRNAPNLKQQSSSSSNPSRGQTSWHSREAHSWPCLIDNLTLSVLLTALRKEMFLMVKSTETTFGRLVGSYVIDRELVEVSMEPLWLVRRRQMNLNVGLTLQRN